MKKTYVTKEDLQGRVVGIENYIPGDPSTKDMAIKASSGTSGMGPTVVIEKIPVAAKQKAYFDRAHALIRLGGQTTSALAGTNMLFRYAHMDRIMAIDSKDLKHPSIAHALAGFAATELYTVPLSFLRTAIHALRISPAAWAFRRVVYIFLSGEWTSVREKRELQKNFPKLKEYVDDYGSAEAGSYAWSCKYLAQRYLQEGLLVFHPVLAKKDLYLKDADSDGIGEIVVSTNELTDYRTGDAGKLISESCECGSKQTLVLFGRIDADYLNCAGATFALQEVDRVFESLVDMVVQYQMRVKELDDGVTLRGEIMIDITLTKEYAKQLKIESYIAEFVNRTLQVTPTRTLGELIASGIFLPTIVTTVKKIHMTDYKRSRLKKIV